MVPLTIHHRHFLHRTWYSICPDTKNLSSPSFHRQRVSRPISKSGHKSSPSMIKRRKPLISANNSALMHALA
ncbi:hypothetical protein ES332_A11G166700v1 [Gossypium tomentosum]|uniref:Uncharacterized protein n=1 Tax=Gossypium tomentosum TaxID=34277 RepID=A0A5D2NC23_GOSTO|nr:hypothetical protein ES332_A11G166700v1 [Gossypium tomentosum]